MIKKMNNIKLLLITLTLVMSQFVSAQHSDLKFRKVIAEFGAGYPITLSDQKEDFSAFFNLGFNKLIGDRYIIGPHVFTCFDVSGLGNPIDYSTGLGVKIGKVINDNEVSFNLGYTIVSKKYGRLPGPLMGMQIPLNSKVGLHLRYKELNAPDFNKRKVLEVGMNFKGDAIVKYVLPTIGVAAIVLGVIANAIAGSR